MIEIWPWLALFGLGAFHGSNPAMGWLFALSFGLQEGKCNAVLRALPPIAAGHALSIGAILLLVTLAGAILPHSVLKKASAFALFGFGLYRLGRLRHPKWVGMRVGFADLTLWSFLMASAHGAGLMLIPIVLSGNAQPDIYLDRAQPNLNIEPFCSASATPFSTPQLLAASLGVHTLGHFLVAGLVALLVYRTVGVQILRHAWVNLDWLWAFALFATGALLLLV